MNALEETVLPNLRYRDMGFSQNYQTVPHPLRREHWHSVYEVLYVRRGWGQMKLNADVFPFYPGDVIAVRAGDVHSNGYSSPDGCDIDILQFTSACLYQSEQIAQDFCSGILHPADSSFQQLFDALHHYTGEPFPGQEQILAGLVHMVTGLLLRSGNRQQAQALSGTIRQICAYLESADDLSLANTARRFNYSSEHLSRKFHAETGISYRQWCARLRMEKAAVLLGNDMYSVPEIAEAAGYSDASSFIRAFGQTYGLTPSAYRRRKRNVHLSFSVEKS